MPTGITRTGNRADGALVIVYHMDGAEPEMLMGEETVYVTDYEEQIAKYRRDFHTSIRDAFTYPGNVNLPANLAAANTYFAAKTAAMNAVSSIGRITYADVKNSSKAGLISAKPRFVLNKGSLGFTKGGYEHSDRTLENTAVREVMEETGVIIEGGRLVDTGQLLYTNKKKDTQYVVYLYKLSDAEYRAITDGGILLRKNADWYNELQSIRFARRPAVFANAISEEAYGTAKGRLVGGTKRSPNKTKARLRPKRRLSIKLTTIPADTVYTETQKSRFCGQHALNHILQEQKFISPAGPIALKHKRLDGKIDLKAFCKYVRTSSRKALGPAANETIDCPADGDYQADILVRVIKDEMRYTVTELPFHEEGVEALKQQLPIVRPRLLGLLVNLGGYHWTAVVSRARQPYHLYIDSMEIPKTFDLMTDTVMIDRLLKLNPYRIYMISIPESGAYYRCRQC